MKLDLTTITRILPDAICEGAQCELTGRWTIDSRTVAAGDIFVALAGTHVDGHAFITEALQRGAIGCVVAAQAWPSIRPTIVDYLNLCMIIIVQNPLDALMGLAAAWRAQFTYPVVGITGSLGKTTTKELIKTILATADRPALITQGNQNTLIGIALNILRMREEHTVAIFEMGISKRGEMARLTALVRPTIALITCIAHSHLEGLGTITEIAAEKRHIFDGMQPDHTGIIFGDQAALSVAYNIPMIRFGSKMHNQIQARQIRRTPNGISFTIKIYKERFAITVNSTHMGRVYNMLAAASVAHCLGIPAATIVTALMSAEAVPGRFVTYTTPQRHTIIDDSYNACPESMKEALIAFDHLQTEQRKIVILGEMLELGIHSSFWHRQLGRILRKVNSISHVILVGERCSMWVEKTLPRNLRYEIKQSWSSAAASLQEYAAAEQLCILVKGSRGIALDRLVTTFREHTP